MLNSVQFSNTSDANGPARVPEPVGVTAGGLALAAAGWAVAIPVAPLAAPVAPVATTALYAIGALICHQLPERSFHVDGHQWLVCARCSGLYAGAGLGALLAWAYVRRHPSVVWPRPRVLTTLQVVALPTLITVGTAWLGLGDPPNRWRAVLAVPLGLVAGAVAVALVSDRVK